MGKKHDPNEGRVVVAIPLTLIGVPFMYWMHQQEWGLSPQYKFLLMGLIGWVLIPSIVCLITTRLYIWIGIITNLLTAEAFKRVTFDIVGIKLSNVSKKVLIAEFVIYVTAVLFGAIIGLLIKHVRKPVHKLYF